MGHRRGKKMHFMKTLDVLGGRHQAVKLCQTGALAASRNSRERVVAHPHESD